MSLLHLAKYLCETMQKGVMVNDMENTELRHESGRPEVWLILRESDGRMVDARAFAITNEDDYDEICEVCADVSNGTDGAVVQRPVLVGSADGEDEAERMARAVNVAVHAVRVRVGSRLPGRARAGRS
jgi:uncharacterized protein YrzB (UPF0473 family)